LAKARNLADNASGPGRISYGELDKNTLENSLHDTDLLVNSTPIRTLALIAKLKIPLNKLKNTDCVFDLAYDKSSEPLPVGHRTIKTPLRCFLQERALFRA